ncbi:cobalamin biosynthesis protein CbiD [Leptospira mayottensis]|nr:cobalamin biosynthesis protein CbiD [Leptospira mayottensis]AZQ04090.1 cobalamin biosynthesis protein CbiD [Leptospira mayottensis 200901116]TGN11223.1 cobalamin biosynthesis protein CbiD [Leptospira mayottensis]
MCAVSTSAGNKEISRNVLGIFIVGTTGIVKPFSTAAFKASVIQAIRMAREYEVDTVILTTGGKSEKFAMNLFPNLKELSFIQVGDFIGTGIKISVKESIRHVIIVGMIRKLSKMADGVMMTHRGGSSVNTKMLSDIARSVGISEPIAIDIQNANTARHALEICRQNAYSRKTDNVYVIPGKAPEVLEVLPGPDCIFVGGSKGNLYDIIRISLNRIASLGSLVIDAVTLDNVTEAYHSFKKLTLVPEVTLLNISRGQPLTNYLKYEALNPIHIFKIIKPDGFFA